MLLKNNLQERAFILSNGNIFFHRFCDGSFKSKWSGLWKEYKKYLEYFAIKINKEWASKFLEKVEYDSINDVVKFFYKINDAEIVEKNFLSGNSLIIEIESNKECEIELEIAFNIREWRENYHERSYEISYFKNKYEISSPKGKVFVETFQDVEYVGVEYYKVHYPSFQAQRCFVPKNIKTLGKNLTIKITIEKEKRDFFDNKQFLLKNKIIFPKKFVEKLFYISALNLRKLYNKDKNFFFAGFPWYTQLWARDSAYMIIAASKIGMFQEAKSTLKSLLYFSNKKIPNFVVDSEISYNSEDSTPLFLISLYHYIKNTADLNFFIENRNKIEEFIDYYFSRKNSLGFVYCEKGSTWMDTLGKDGYFLEVQVLWSAALGYLYEIYKFLGIERKELIEESEKLRNNILKYYFSDGIFVDELNSKNYNINTIFPLVFDVYNSTETLERIERDFSTEYGYSTIPKSNVFFDPQSYHLGSSWGYIVALIAYLHSKYKNTEKALNALKKIYEMRNVFCLNCLPEAWNSVKKDLKLKKPIGIEEGAFLQGWTAACSIIAIEELCGIDVDAINERIYINPKVEGKIFRRKFVGNDIVDIYVFSKNGKKEVKYKSFLRKKYNVIII